MVVLANFSVEVSEYDPNPGDWGGGYEGDDHGDEWDCDRDRDQVDTRHVDMN
jgi:hypothetical protein